MYRWRSPEHHCLTNPKCYHGGGVGSFGCWSWLARHTMLCISDRPPRVQRKQIQACYYKIVPLTADRRTWRAYNDKRLCIFGYNDTYSTDHRRTQLIHSNYPAPYQDNFVWFVKHSLVFRAMFKQLI
jgi:hypothetical protein